MPCSGHARARPGYRVCVPVPAALLASLALACLPIAAYAGSASIPPIADAVTLSARELLQVRAVTALQTVLLTVALLVALFWLRMREGVLLLLAASLAAQALYLAATSEPGSGFALVRWLDLFEGGGARIAAVAATLAGLLFLREFIDLSAQQPRSSNAVTLAAVALAALLVPLASPWPLELDWLPALADVLVAVAVGLGIVVLAQALRLGNRPARIALLAWLPLALLAGWDWMNELPAGWPALAPPATMAYGALVLCLGLADGVLAIRGERDSALRLAGQDPLTGTLNRSTLMHHLDRLMEEARLQHEPLSVVFLDLDHFKRVNDRYGHATGDACLVAVVQVIQAELRQHDVLGRYGGEEFAIVLPGAGAAHANGVAERIRRHVERGCRVLRGHAVDLTVSLGIAEFHPGRDTRAALLERADLAMYAAKSGGRNRVQVARPV